MQPELIVMVGISGSGKSTFTKGLKTSLSANVISTDDIRLELTQNAEDQSQNGRVFSIARQRVNDSLKNGRNTVIDATSLTVKDRKEWIAIGRYNEAKITAYVINTTIDVAKKRNSERDRKVPEWVIDKQFAKFKHPSVSEGFDKIVTI